MCVQSSQSVDGEEISSSHPSTATVINSLQADIQPNKGHMENRLLI